MEKRHPKYHYKYCPRCSAQGQFDEQHMSFKCPACGFNFFINSAAAVTGLIFNTNNELLFTRRGIEPGYGMLDLPGGFVDPGETAEEALKRELKEELSADIAEIQYYTSFANEYLFSGTIVHTTDLFFRCTLFNIDSLICRDDVKSYEFHRVNEISTDMFPFESVKKLLKQLRNEP